MYYWGYILGLICSFFQFVNSKDISCIQMSIYISLNNNQFYLYIGFYIRRGPHSHPLSREGRGTTPSCPGQDGVVPRPSLSDQNRKGYPPPPQERTGYGLGGTPLTVSRGRSVLFNNVFYFYRLVLTNSTSSWRSRDRPG